jgi:hypothetical protein
MLLLLRKSTTLALYRITLCIYVIVNSFAARLEHPASETTARARKNLFRFPNDVLRQYSAQCRSEVDLFCNGKGVTNLNERRVSYRRCA